MMDSTESFHSILTLNLPTETNTKKSIKCCCITCDSCCLWWFFNNNIGMVNEDDSSCCCCPECLIIRCNYDYKGYICCCNKDKTECLCCCCTVIFENK